MKRDSTEGVAPCVMRPSGLPGLAKALLISVVGVFPVQAGTPQTFDVRSLENGQMWQSRMLTRAIPDPGCRAQYGLSESEGEGEHTVYQATEMRDEVGVRLRVKAALRYGVQIGFASHDWSSYALTTVSLISGAQTVSEGGALKSIRSSVAVRPDGWVEIDFGAANQRGARSREEAIGFAFIKLTADGGLKEYRGRPGYGIELCAIGP
jgi:hypothetical protein